MNRTQKPKSQTEPPRNEQNPKPKNDPEMNKNPKQRKSQTTPTVKMSPSSHVNPKVPQNGEIIQAQGPGFGEEKVLQSFLSDVGPKFFGSRFFERTNMFARFERGKTKSTRRRTPFETSPTIWDFRARPVESGCKSWHYQTTKKLHNQNLLEETQIYLIHLK